MTRISLALAAVALIAASPAFAAKGDCDTKFKDFMGKMSTYVPGMPANDLAEAIRKSLRGYDTCNAGDELAPYGLWNDILAEAAKKSGK